MDNNSFEPDYKVIKNERRGISQALSCLGFGIIGGLVVMFAFMGMQQLNINNKAQNTSAVSEIVVNDSATKNLVNIVNYSDTSIKVAEKVLPSVVGITVQYSVNSIFGGSGTGEASGSGVILTQDRLYINKQSCYFITK